LRPPWRAGWSCGRPGTATCTTGRAGAGSRSTGSRSITSARSNTGSNGTLSPRKLRQAHGVTDLRNPEQRQAYHDAGREAERILAERGILSQGWFETSLAEYLTLALDDALASDDLVHRALAVLDGRLGKRRLQSFPLRADESPLVRRLLDLRCEAEGVRRR